uniref:Enolase superfamily member 1 n=1 Tax=Equus caballus TaxID=9796 RepID=A0A9L0STJ2_HORSE
ILRSTLLASIQSSCFGGISGFPQIGARLAFPGCTCCSYLISLSCLFSGSSRLRFSAGRFPQHTDPDYSAAYVVLETDAGDGLKGYGITFTLGKGTEVVVCAVNALAHHVLHKDLKDIVGDFRAFYRQLTSDGQLRWIGPEKGVVHLATAAVLNAVWDLWAKQEGKPLWKLLVDMKYCRKVKLVKKKEKSKCWCRATPPTPRRAPGSATQTTR